MTLKRHDWECWKGESGALCCPTLPVNCFLTMLLDYRYLKEEQWRHSVPLLRQYGMSAEHSAFRLSGAQPLSCMQSSWGLGAGWRYHCVKMQKVRHGSRAPTPFVNKDVHPGTARGVETPVSLIAGTSSVSRAGQGWALEGDQNCKSIHTYPGPPSCTKGRSSHATRGYMHATL